MYSVVTSMMHKVPIQSDRLRLRWTHYQVGIHICTMFAMIYMPFVGSVLQPSRPDFIQLSMSAVDIIEQDGLAFP
jgi:hypothetical protein